MRLIQIVAKRFVSLCFLLGGALLIAMRLNDNVYNRVESLFGMIPRYVWTEMGIVVGSVLIIIGLLGMFPTKKRKRKNVITFPGTQGQITIELAPVEATLNRVVSKMPEVKKISVTVTPSEDNLRAQVDADVWIYKGAETAGAREITNRIENHLKDTAVNILGVEDVTTVNVRVRGIKFDPTRTVAQSAAAAKSVQAVTDEPAPLVQPEPEVEQRPAWRHEPAPSEPHPFVSQEEREEETSFTALDELPPLTRSEDEEENVEESQEEEREHELRLGAYDSDEEDKKRSENF